MQLKTDGSEEQEDKLCTTKPEADIKKSYQWLATVSLTDSTEALITAAQEQALMVKSTVTKSTTTANKPRVAYCAKELP